MKRSRAVGSQSSTYGQACTQCYKAKRQCVRTGNSEKCDRCLRLKKRCEPSESTRRRNAQTAIAEASDARIARLEEKMESLLSAIRLLHRLAGIFTQRPPATRRRELIVIYFVF